jgi:hypothetical protein
MRTTGRRPDEGNTQQDAMTSMIGPNPQSVEPQEDQLGDVPQRSTWITTVMDKIRLPGDQVDDELQRGTMTSKTG